MDSNNTNTPLVNVITADEYQKQANRTVNKDLTETELLLDGLMGLNGEAGEAIDICKKWLFQEHELDMPHLIEELGDVAWYLAITCTALHINLGTVMEENIRKLYERYPEGFNSEQSINGR